MAIDHHTRAARLREIIEEHHHLREWEEDYPDVDLDGEIPKVPQRFVTLGYDGSTTALGFADSLEEAAGWLTEAATNDYPDAPSGVRDLDTGIDYEPTVRVTLEPMDVEVELTYSEAAGGGVRVFKTTRAIAERWVADQGEETTARIL